MPQLPTRTARLVCLLGLVGAAAGLTAAVVKSPPRPTAAPPRDRPQPLYEPRKQLDPGGFGVLPAGIDRWAPDASLEEVSNSWREAGRQQIEFLDQRLTVPRLSDEARVRALLMKAAVYNADGDPVRAYHACEQARSVAEADDELAGKWLFTVIFFQGMTALRRGETDNCVLCRGESSCILPISPAAVHTNPLGSRLAVGHFTEYLRQFPDDLGVRWLLNVAHMTLGEHPHQVDPRFLVPLDRYLRSEFDIGRFRDVGALVGVNRFNQAGGAILEDFDNDGLLDLAVSTMDPTQSMALYRNKGDGTFEDRTRAAGLAGQLGGQ
jgi:hypothetical protein